MKKKIKKLSGHELIKAFSKMGFKSKRQTGSHVILVKETPNGKVGCVVPLHKELKIGTLKGILKQAKLEEEDLLRYM